MNRKLCATLSPIQDLPKLTIHTATSAHIKEQNLKEQKELDGQDKQRNGKKILNVDLNDLE